MSFTFVSYIRKSVRFTNVFNGDISVILFSPIVNFVKDVKPLSAVNVVTLFWYIAKSVNAVNFDNGVIFDILFPYIRRYVNFVKDPKALIFVMLL